MKVAIITANTAVYKGNEEDASGKVMKHYRMREGQIQKVPYLLVIGFNEQENKTVSYRLHGEADTTVLPLNEFVEKIENEIKNKLR